MDDAATTEAGVLVGLRGSGVLGSAILELSEIIGFRLTIPGPGEPVGMCGSSVLGFASIGLGEAMGFKLAMENGDPVGLRGSGVLGSRDSFKLSGEIETRSRSGVASVSCIVGILSGACEIGVTNSSSV